MQFKKKRTKSKDRSSHDGKMAVSDGVSVHILPGSIRLKLKVLILSGKDVVRIPKTTIKTKEFTATNKSNFMISLQNVKDYGFLRFLLHHILCEILITLYNVYVIK